MEKELEEKANAAAAGEMKLHLHLLIFHVVSLKISTDVGIIDSYRSVVREARCNKKGMLSNKNVSLEDPEEP